MPLPVGHSLAGLITAELAPGKRYWPTALTAVAVANLADLDFLPGLLVGHPNRYHHGLSHTLAAALLLAALVHFVPWLRRRCPLSALAVFLTYAGHLALDWTTVDLRPPFGLMALWPFSSKYFIAASPLFWNIERADRSAGFFPSLLCRHNLAAAGREFLLVGGVWLLVAAVVRLWRWRAEKLGGALRPR